MIDLHRKAKKSRQPTPEGAWVLTERQRHGVAALVVSHSMRATILISLLLVGFCCASCRSTSDPKATWTPGEGYECLTAVRCFAFGPVGMDADTSTGECGFRAVLRSRNPSALFRLVVSNGTEEGKLYGLCGIRATDRASFDRYAAIVASTNAEVITLSGCIGGHKRAADVVEQTITGVYDKYLTKR